MDSIDVDFEMVALRAREMGEEIARYQSLYTTLMTTVDETAAVWQGKDQQAYVARIHQFEDDFVKMRQLLENYQHFLLKSIDAYAAAQDEAVRLSQLLVG